MPAIAAEALTPDQKAATDRLVSGPRGGLRGPFISLLRSPQMMDRTQQLGEYLRYNAALPEPLREFCILVTARIWDQSYEWYVHAPLANKAGIASDVIADIAARRRPESAGDEALAIYDFCEQLHRTHGVDDDAYGRVLTAFGEQGVIDLVGMCGYYALLAMAINVARTPLPANAVPFAVP